MARANASSMAKAKIIAPKTKPKLSTRRTREVLREANALTRKDPQVGKSQTRLSRFGESTAHVHGTIARLSLADHAVIVDVKGDDRLAYTVYVKCGDLGPG